MTIESLLFRMVNSDIYINNRDQYYVKGFINDEIVSHSLVEKLQDLGFIEQCSFSWEQWQLTYEAANYLTQNHIERISKLSLW